MSQKLQYEGFIIEADPELLETGRWITFVEIHRHSGSRVSSRVSREYETYETQEEAIIGCVEFGKLIIDGGFPDLIKKLP
ncbi:MAG: DUF6566 family protein [Syntrophales bacterium]|jgi:hypothetical protein